MRQRWKLSRFLYSVRTQYSRKPEVNPDGKVHFFRLLTYSVFTITRTFKDSCIQRSNIQQMSQATLDINGLNQKAELKYFDKNGQFFVLNFNQRCSSIELLSSPFSARYCSRPINMNFWENMFEFYLVIQSFQRF